MKILLQIWCCILITAALLYSYVNKRNQLMSVQMKLPIAEKRLQKIEEEITQLQYEKEKFENPIHLMELARHPQFGHLKYPAHLHCIEVHKTAVSDSVQEGI